MSEPRRVPKGVTDARARFSARARRAKLSRRRRLLVVLVGGIAPVGAVGALLLSPVLDVESVRVLGVQRLPAGHVLDAADVEPGAALALVDVGDVQRRVAALAYVKSVSVRREWPSRLVVRVEERVPALAVPVSGGVALYDADGVRLGGASGVPRGVPLLRVFGGRPAPELVKAVVAVVRSVPEAVRADVLGYSATSPEEVMFALRGNREVVWGSADDGAEKARVLLALLRRPGSHYDVRAPGAPAVR